MRSKGVVGCIALPTPGSVLRGKVVAVFSRCVHVAMQDGDFLVLGGKDLAAHPAAVLWPDFAVDLELGRKIAVTSEGIFKEDALYRTFEGMCLFTPGSGCRPMAPTDRVLAALGASLRRAAGFSMRGGFHEIMLRRLGVVPEHPSGRLEDRLARLGSARWAELARALGLGDWAAFKQQALECAGMGAGLTPAGDDFLGGVLAALRYHGESSGREVVSQQFFDDLARSAKLRTTPFSGFLLGCAARGQVAEPFAAWILAVHRGQVETAARHVLDIAAVGHSSGLDTLAGMLLALRGIMGERPWTEW
jgi:hypothetical protein